MPVNPTIVAAIIALTVTSAGWLVVHHLTRRRELEARLASDARADRTRRLELQLRHYERQIEEFYGPIYSMIQTIFAIWHVKNRLETEISPADNDKPVEEVKAKFGQFAAAAYFNPIHQEVRDILNRKLFLTKGAAMTDSFYAYLKHSLMENMQYRLWAEHGISSISVKGEEFSQRFVDDIKRGLDDAVKRYDQLLQELQRSPDGASDGRRENSLLQRAADVFRRRAA